MKLLQQTQMVVTFQFSTDREAELVAILQLITTLMMILWNMGKVAYQCYHGVAGFWCDFWQTVRFVGKVYAIGFNSLRWGLGL